VFCFTFG